MHTQNDEQLTQAKYSEWLASLVGACFVAFALGIWLSDVLNSLAWALLIMGVALHAYGMYATYQRNK